MYISTTLPYDLETLQSFVIGFHHSIWPLQLLFLALAVVALWRLNYPSELSTRLLGGILSIFWGFSGYAFYISSFSNLSFLAAYIGCFFIIQSIVMFIGFTLTKGPVLSAAPAGNHKLGIGLVLTALLLYPMAISIMTKSIDAIPVVGVTPLATSIFTLGVLSFYQGDMRRWFIFATIPAFHVVLSLVFAVFLIMQN